MAQDSIEKRLIELLEAEAPEHGVDIVDVEVVGSKKAPVVRVRIDNADEDAGTISLDEVSRQNDWISAKLDEFDPFPGSYTLEVSSPGLSRPLRKARDFERFAGEEVSLTTTATEGRKHFTGRLAGLVEGKVRIACDDGDHDFELDEVKSCHIKPDFDAAMRAGSHTK